MAYRPQFKISSHLLNIIEEISAFRERILTASIELLWIPSLQQEARVKNTHSSTAIEGNPLSEEEVHRLARGESVAHASEKSRREVLNYLAALRFIEKNADKKKVHETDILKLHRMIATKVMDQGVSGAYRELNVRVGSYVAPDWREVPQMMTDLIDWMNVAATEWSPVISSAIIHYRFEEIHPFGDGNGRVGRVLALWDLYRRGFDTLHIFSVDEVYWEHRSRYYQALAAVQMQRGDLSGWLEYAAEALHLSLERVCQRIQKLSLEKRVGPKLILRPSQERLLNLMQERGAMSPREIWAALKVTKQGALDILKPLMEEGLVERVGSRKSGKYRMVPL